MGDEHATSRIDKLEERSALQEQAIEDLSDAVTEQWKLIESLKRDISRLTDELKEVEANIEEGGEREPPPPHY
ncbi:MAG: SlyX family protein [Pseudomonadota bacterium]